MVTKQQFINEYARLLGQVVWAVNSPTKLANLLDNCFETIHGADESWPWQSPFAVQAARNLNILNYSLNVLRSLPCDPITDTARKRVYRTAKLCNPMTPDERLKAQLATRAKSLALAIYHDKVDAAIAKAING